MAYEFSVLMDSRVGGDWRETAERILYMDFQQAGMTHDEQEALRAFYGVVLNRNLAASGAPVAGEDRSLSQLRQDLRQEALDVAFSVGGGSILDGGGGDDEEEGRARSGGDGDDCDS